MTDPMGGASVDLSTRGLALACLAAACALAIAGCATGTGAAARGSGGGAGSAATPAGMAGSDPASPPSPYPSTYRRQPSPALLVAHATVLTATGQRLQNASLLLRDGKIAAVGPDAAGARAGGRGRGFDAPA